MVLLLLLLLHAPAGRWLAVPWRGKPLLLLLEDALTSLAAVPYSKHPAACRWQNAEPPVLLLLLVQLQYAVAAVP